MLFIPVQWGGLIYFYSFGVYFRMSINSIPNCLFVLHPFASSWYVQEVLEGGKVEKKNLLFQLGFQFVILV